MTHVVTEACVDHKYQDCVAVCPVEAFRETDTYLVIDPDECIDLGKCVVDNLPPKLPAKTPISLVFYYDVNGRLSVEAQIGDSDVSIPVPIVRAENLENVDLFRWREWVETVMLCSGM